MGTNISCIQVYIGQDPKVGLRQKMIETVSLLMSRKGFVGFQPQTRMGDKLDREILVGPLGETPWLTVTGTDINLTELAEVLSEALSLTTVLIYLIDSSVLHLRRYQNGDLIDDYCKSPDAYWGYGPHESVLSEWENLNAAQLKEKTKGDAEKWADLLASDLTVDELRAIWDSQPIFADDILWASENAFDMNGAELAATLWDELSLEGFDRLPFWSHKKPLYQTPAESPPDLDLSSYFDLEDTDLYAGDLLELDFSVSNQGRSFIGLDICIWGTALTADLMSAKQIEYFDSVATAKKIATFVPVKRILGGEEIDMRLCTLDKLEFPHGVMGMHEIEDGVSWNQFYERIALTKVAFKIMFLIDQIGSGNLNISFIPHENREAGQAIYSGSFNIHAMPRRPLVMKPKTAPVDYAALSRLESPIHLFGLVVLDIFDSQALNLLLQIQQEWLETFEPFQSGKMRRLIKHNAKQRLTSKIISRRSLQSLSYWEGLSNEIAGCVNFMLYHDTSGLIFDANPQSFERANFINEPAPQLFLWFDTSRLDAGTIVFAQDWLSQKINQMMEEGACLQGMVGRWDWQTFNPYLLQSTVYEKACGIGGACTTAHFWSKRYLRGVTADMWLGKDIVSHLEHVDDLAKIGSLIRIGEGIHISLGKGANLDDLEVLLEPLLPREIDWRRGVSRIALRRS